MNLYIRIENGVPVGDPITDQNLQQAYPGINLENNLPNTFAKFQRVPFPRHSVYEKYEETTYEFINGIVQDVHKVTKLTKSEIRQLQTEKKEAWKNNPNTYKSWKFDAATCRFVPPVSYPTDGNNYVWDELSVKWVIFDPTIHLVNETAVYETIDTTVMPDETAIDETIDTTVIPDDPAVTDTPAAE